MGLDKALANKKIGPPSETPKSIKIATPAYETNPPIIFPVILAALIGFLIIRILLIGITIDFIWIESLLMIFNFPLNFTESKVIIRIFLSSKINRVLVFSPSILVNFSIGRESLRDTLDQRISGFRFVNIFKSVLQFFSSIILLTVFAYSGLDFSCINISIGYYDYHTPEEYVVIEDVFSGIDTGKKMIESLGNQKYYLTPRKDSQFLLF